MPKISRKYLLKKTGVYSITNVRNGKRYIGSAAKCIRARWEIHEWSLDNQKHYNRHLQSAWNKFGKDSFVFEVLEFCAPSECINREQVWMDHFKSADRNCGYNLSPTAGSNLGIKLPQLAAAKRGVKRPPHVGIAVSRANKGRVYDAAGRAQLSANAKGAVRSAEFKQSVAKAKRDWWAVPENRETMKEKIRDSWIVRKQPVSNREDVFTFGRGLLTTNDLDPVYVVLWEAISSKRMSTRLLQKWLLAFFCYYDAGTACWIVDQESYWDAMKTAAGSKSYPRSRERRHFRGQSATESVAYLESRGVHGLFSPLVSKKLVSSKAIIDNVKEWRGFGDWVSFKVADILERLNLRPIQFELGVVLYDSPMKGAEEMWNKAGCPECTSVGEWAIDSLIKELGNFTAPPRHERPINAQECETILCKWKSYLGGHYQLGEDIEGMKKALGRFTTPTAGMLLQAGAVGKLW